MSCTSLHLRSHSLNIVSLSDMIEGSYHSWDLYTTGQLVDGLRQKKEKQFSLNGNEIMSSFLGRQFYCSTLYDAASRISSKQHATSLCSFYLTFSPSIFLKFKEYICNDKATSWKNSYFILSQMLTLYKGKIFSLIGFYKQEVISP